MRGLKVLIKCAKCNCSNEVVEVLELDEIENFTSRVLLKSVCKSCNSKLVSLVETRKADNKVFIDSFFGSDVQKVIKRERKRIKNKIQAHKYNGFVYGKNKEIRNKKGEVTQIRQYASDYTTGKQSIVKKIFLPAI